jgi:hypothetical protein
MKLPAWSQRRFQSEPGEDLLYRDRCSWARRPRWISLVGGEVFVTTRRLVFQPNVLAALVEKAAWEEALGESDHTHAEPLDSGRPFGTLPSLHIVTAADAAGSRIIVVKTDDQVAELGTWIDRAKWRL